jgi:hypothetical protein
MNRPQLRVVRAAPRPSPWPDVGHDWRTVGSMAGELALQSILLCFALVWVTVKTLRALAPW